MRTTSGFWAAMRASSSCPHARHAMVGDDDPDLVPGEARERLLRVACRENGELAGEELGDQRQDGRLVVDDQQGRVRSRGLRHGRGRPAAGP